MNPRVRFVVRCYKLAHLLADCVRPILAQSYLRQRIKALAERRRLRSIARERSVAIAAIDASLGDARFDAGEWLFARHYYTRALRQDPWNVRTWTKVGLLGLGHRGAKLPRKLAGRQRLEAPQMPGASRRLIWRSRIARP
jgi:hypothetical protein